MAKSSQMRAVANYRRRLAERGIRRYEVRGLDKDRELIRDLAKRLTRDDDIADRVRAAMAAQIVGGQPRRGGILAALRRSPLVGSELAFERVINSGRNVDL
jgi:hypothetical protein